MRVPGVVHVEVYAFRRRAGRRQVLLLRRAPGQTLAGVWQPVTGSLERRERPADAARRELFEETGLETRDWWLLESPGLYFERPALRPRLLPIFAAEVGPGARVTRSAEHDAHAFVGIAAAARRVLWDAQREALLRLRHQIWGAPALSRALRLPN